MSDERPTFTVDLQPVGRRVQVGAGTTLLAAAQSAGVELQSVCGGVGTCGGCKVRVAVGAVSPATATENHEMSREEMAAGYRLACQAIAVSDVRVDIPPGSLSAPQRVQVEGQELNVKLDPVVFAVEVKVAPPSLSDLRSDLSRLNSALAPRNGEVEVPCEVLAGLPETLRVQHWAARLALRKVGSRCRVVGVLPPRSRMFGLAVDVGTTKLAAYLIDIENGQTVAQKGVVNPQVAYGEDVISRISFSNQDPAGQNVMQSKLIEATNHLAADLCSEAGAVPQQIVDAVVVGNTVMHHLFAGLPVQQLGIAPFVPVVSDALEIPAEQIGLALSCGALIYMPPNIAGYVGADHVAMLLGSGIHQSARTVIAIDIGTNTEITLAFRGRLLSCSCASGPAFEGAHIQHGMRAASGAIERVRIIDGEVHTHTIGGVPPVGICGSGIVDAVAEMLYAGVLDNRGNFRRDSTLVHPSEGQNKFVLVPARATGHASDIAVTRSDVNEIQLAKAAIRTGIEILLREVGIDSADIDEVVIAGAFGSYLDIRSAVQLGMFPPLAQERFHQIGNGAGSGARQMLISGDQRRTAERIARQIEYVELTNHPAFSERFQTELCFRSGYHSCLSH
jgi:uncharacterized 2Fe-2S/4Fe-4S cluster protein (DUF4445 family)